MKFQEAVEELIWNFRLDFDPVGIRFVFHEQEIERLPVTASAKTRLTYCQYLASVRLGQFSLFMKPARLLCENAAPVFGFRPLDKEADTKRHTKYLLDPEVAWAVPQGKARLEEGTCKGIYVAPCKAYDAIGMTPSVVFIMCTPYQAYHVLNDYMGAMRRPNLSFFHTPNSAVCSGGVWAYRNHTVNMTTMCAGSMTSGKSEMNYVNLFIPGDQFLPTVEQLRKRCEETGGPSTLGEGGEPWPGMDVCKACPLFRFERVE